MTAVENADRTSAAEPPRHTNAVALTAAARRLDPTDRALAAKVKAWRQDWQRHAWDFDETLSEIHYAHDYYGNTVSRVRLFAGFQTDPDNPPVTLDKLAAADEAPEGSSPEVSAAALDEMGRLDAGADGGLPAIAGDFAVNLALAGEGYLHGRLDKGSLTGESFAVYSVDEFKPSDMGYAIHPRGASVGEPVQPDDFVLRVWRRFRRFRDLADAPMRALLDDCDNLLLLKRVLYAANASRMHGGIFLYPQEWTFPQRATDPNADGQAVDDPLQEQMMRAFTTPLTNPRSVASVMPLNLKGPADTLDKARWLDLGRGYGSEILDQIEKVRRILAVGLDLPIEVIEGHMNTTFCVDDETEALTIDGWRRHDQIETGTLVLTLNHDTGLSEWQPASAINRFEVVDEPVLRIERKAHSSVTTSAHRWPVILRDTPQRGLNPRAWRRSAGSSHERLNTNCRVPTAAPCLDVPAEAKWSDDLVELVAWFYTEGHVDRRHRTVGGQAVITQSAAANPQHVDRIRNVLTRLVGPSVASLRTVERAWREYHDPNGSNVRFYLSRALTADLEMAAPDRVPQPDFIRALTRAQLELFILVSGYADGWIVSSGTRMFSQNDPARVDGYELACILSGRTPSRWSTLAEGTGTLRGRYFEQHYCSVSDRTTIQPITTYSRARRAGAGISEWSTYTGTMWCPTTPNQTWMARRNGKVYFTGNSNAQQIAEDTFKAHIEPLVLVICRALTDGYLWPMLRARGLDPSGYVVGYDASALIGHPDLFANVALAHQRFAASDDALRRAGGMSDEDAPLPDEIERRIYIESHSSPLALAQEAKTGAVGDVAADVLDTPDRAPSAAEPGPPALVATAGLPLAQLGPRLSKIDQDLRARIQTLADSALQRALERAGAMVARKARPGRASSGRINVKLSELAREMGRERVLSMGLTEDKLIDGELGELESDYRKLTKRALAAALLAGRRAVPDGDLDEERIRALSREQDDWVAGGFAILSAAVLSAAHEQLFTPAAVPSGPGEIDLSARVSPSAVRESLAVAGGAPAVRTLEDAPPGGVATGTIVMDAFKEALQVLPQGWQWVYGYPDREFEPHAVLEGVEFSSWEDEILANPEDWPDVSHFYPSDHQGCACSYIPMFESDRTEDLLADEESVE